MPVSADRLKVPPVATAETGLGMTVSKLAGGFCGEAKASTEAAAGAVAGAVAAFGPTAGEAGFPQETRVIAPNKKVDSCHK